MQILLALGGISEAKRLVPITSAHVSGASYKMIGDPGLEFLEDFARDARVAVPTTVNPLGTDLAQWKELGIPPDLAGKQARIGRAYATMGFRPSFSCTPYLIGVRPGLGEHVAWAESNAVCFANSVLGARTNREGGPSALAAAIVGATPEYGLHKDEGRRPTVRVNVTTKPHGLDFSLIGLVAGQQVGDSLPFFRGFRGSEEDLKWLGAALASTGACAMFHLEGVTPEARRARTAGLPSLTISRADLVQAQRSCTDGTQAEGHPRRARRPPGAVRMKLRGRGIASGFAEGIAFVIRVPFSFVGGADPATGTVLDAATGGANERLDGRIFAFPHGKGSTVGSYVIYGLAKRGVGPAGIVNSR